MKAIITFTTLVLLVAPAWAYHQDNDPDQKQSITNVHASHFPHVEGDRHDPERGEGDAYGSILLNIQAGERLFPTSPAIAMRPAKGMGAPMVRRSITEL
ncbi:hypothetical protein [Thiobacillus denitrificans]|uniref:Uncharacterized protein n=1 Tax=Thiobacillus denitrificans TaxID=36861 RepID=A0A106BKL0_THIDE|nr:hypothetical protein [Thiobacillus denitrificans]KVW94208.1 hypothetical protein ABW22_12455 [Thiobacillus denitrificans]